MKERNDFLALLEANMDDLETRLIYADWLDDNGYHEEAERQRDWQKSKDWMVQFCEENNRYAGIYGFHDLSFPKILRYARDAAEQDNYTMRCYNNETMADALRENGKEFWYHWSVLTGIPLGPDFDEGSVWFSCAC